MLFKNTLRATFFLATLSMLLYSCITVDKSVGDQYVPKDHMLEIKTATFRLPLGLKAMDSLQGASTSYAAVGAFNTNQFGIAKFGVAGNVCPNTSKMDLGKDLKVISTSMNITLAAVEQATSSSSSYYSSGGVSSLERTSIILDPSQKGITQNLHVYRLKKALDSTQVYTNSLTEDDYYPQQLNTSAATYFGTDSIKFYLDNAYGIELLSATQEQLDSLDLFVENFGGLFIACDAPTTPDGGRLNLFSQGGITINIKCNFQPTWDENLERKDTTITMAFAYGYCLNISSYGSHSLQTNEPLERLPIEGAGGIAPYLDMQSFKDSLDTWAAKEGYDPSKIVIARATAVLPYEFPSDINLLEYRYPSSLFPAHRDFKDDTTLVKYYYPIDDYDLVGSSLGAINRSLKQYRCDMSSTMQKIINMPKQELGEVHNLWFYPFMSETDEYYGTTLYYIDNYSYFMGEINGPKAERYPYLEIVYAVMDHGF